VMEANLKALKERAKDSPALLRYREIARLLTGKASATDEDGLKWIRSTGGELSIPKLSTFGLNEKDLPAIALQALKASSMKGNPVALTAEELTGILAASLT